MAQKSKDRSQPVIATFSVTSREQVTALQSVKMEDDQPAYKVMYIGPDSIMVELMDPDAYPIRDLEPIP
jgi:hypothetical protein